jgi:hypothetical protein
MQIQKKLGTNHNLKKNRKTPFFSTLHSFSFILLSSFTYTQKNEQKEREKSFAHFVLCIEIPRQISKSGFDESDTRSDHIFTHLYSIVFCI